MADSSSSGSGGEDDDNVQVQVITDEDFTKDYDWDVDTARGIHENDEQWSLRRAFLLENKTKLPRLRAQCLSQVFVNMEFLGCKYPAETMAEVAELSEGLLEDFTLAQKQEGKGLSQRTLVTASSTAQKKYNKDGFYGFVKSSVAEEIVKITEETSILLSPTKRKSTEEIQAVFDRDRDENDSPAQLSPVASSASEEGIVFQTDPVICTSSCFKGLILLEPLFREESPITVLSNSCNTCNVLGTFSKPELEPATGYYKIEFRFGPIMEPTFVASLTTISKDTAKVQLAVHVIRRMKLHVYSVQIKAAVSTQSSENEIPRSELIKKRKLTSSEDADVGTGSRNETVIGDDNIGNRMLRALGWSGGALGKNETGITEPINSSNAIGRSRLGLGAIRSPASCELQRNKLTQFLTKELVQDPDIFKEIVFSPEFTKEERSIMHVVARHLNLKSSSTGIDPDRYIVIKHKVKYDKLLEEIVARGGETPKYRVIKPLCSEDT